MQNIQDTLINDLIEKYQSQKNEIDDVRKQIDVLKIIIDKISLSSKSSVKQELNPEEILTPNQYHYVAKLDINKTEILNVYIDRKTASLCNGFKPGSLDRIVKEKKVYNDNYYILFNECDLDLRNKFLKEKEFLPLFKNGIGQYNSENTLIKEFVSRTNCCTDLKMCDKTLSKSIKNGDLYKESTFKVLPERTQMVKN